LDLQRHSCKISVLVILKIQDSHMYQNWIRLIYEDKEPVLKLAKDTVNSFI